MSNPTCDAASLVASSACFDGSNLSKPTQKALKIYMMAAQLAAIGGTNYTSVLSTTLVTDAKCFVNLDSNRRSAVAVAVEKNNAVAAGATISSSIQTLAGNIKCLKNVPENTLDAIEIMLRCQLGRAKAYPQ